MDPRPLYVLHDAGDEHLLPVGDKVHFQLRAGHVLVHQYRVVDAPGEYCLHVFPGLFRRTGDAHVLPAYDIGGAQQHRVAQLLRCLQGLLQGVDPPALGAADAELLQQGVEAGAVLRQVYAVGGGAQYLHSQAVQVLGELYGGLTAEGHHHAYGLFHPQNVPHILGAEGLKVEAVGGVVVGGDGLRVVVDYHHVVAQLPEGPHAVDAAVVEFYALAYADGAGTQNHDHGLSAAGEVGGLAVFVKAGIEVGGLGVKFRGAGVHHLVAHGHAGHFLHAGYAAEGGVGVAQELGLFVFLRAESLSFNGLLKGGKARQLVEEPFVDAGDGVYLLHGYALFQGLKDSEEPVVILFMEPLRHRGCAEGRGVESVQPYFRPPDCLHQGHLEIGGYCHDLPGGLHLGAQLTAGAGELVKGPLGQLHHHVVQSGLEAGAGLAGYLVFYLVQGVAQGDAGAYLGYGVAGGLGGQGRGAGHPGVDLDDGVLKGVRVQGKLAVAAAHYAQTGDDIQGGGAEHLILLVRQGQGRGHHYGVPGVYAHRVKVLHGAHRHGVAGGVPQCLEFYLLPAGDAALHQYLVDGGLVQPALGDDAQFFLVGGYAAAGAPQGEGGADYHRVAYLPGYLQSPVQVLGSGGGDDRLAHLLKSLPEQFPVLRPVYCLYVRAQQAHAEAVQSAVPAQLHGYGKARLAPKPCQQGVGALLLDYPGHGLGSQGLQVYLVCQVLVGHDGGGIGVDQYGADALLAQHPAGLGSGVVELCRLAYDDRPRADDQYLVYALVLRHCPYLPSWK